MHASAPTPETPIKSVVLLAFSLVAEYMGLRKSAHSELLKRGIESVRGLAVGGLAILDRNPCCVL